MNDKNKAKALWVFHNMIPGVWCAECKVMAIQNGDYLCHHCREDREKQLG